MKTWLATGGCQTWLHLSCARARALFNHASRDSASAVYSQIGFCGKCFPEMEAARPVASRVASPSPVASPSGSGSASPVPAPASTGAHSAPAGVRPASAAASACRASAPACPASAAASAPAGAGGRSTSAAGSAPPGAHLAGAPSAAAVRSAPTIGPAAFEAELSAAILRHMRGSNAILRSVSALQQHLAEEAQMILPASYNLRNKLVRMGADNQLVVVYHPETRKLLGLILPEWEQDYRDYRGTQ